MSVGKCLMSLFYPWQNEFLTTWLYIVFAVYFWVELILIMAMSHKEYNFNNITDYYWMFIATLGIAMSLTFTAIYLTFYPLSEKKREFFESFNYQGILIMVFAATFAFMGSELAGRNSYFYLLFSAFVVFVTCLVLVQYESGRVVSFWLTLGYVVAILVIDCFFLSTKR
jgi:predicted membrane channel-forming protein YqfA (hemolysin III family)